MSVTVNLGNFSFFKKSSSFGRMRQESSDFSAPGLTKRVLIQRYVLSDHPVDGEILFHVMTYGGWIHIQVACPPGHIPNRTATVSRNSVTHDLRDRAAGHREHRCAARHCFDHDQPEWLVPLDWEQHGHRIAQQFVLGLKVCHPM